MAPRMTDFGRKHPSRRTARTTQRWTFTVGLPPPRFGRSFISVPETYSSRGAAIYTAYLSTLVAVIRHNAEAHPVISCRCLSDDVCTENELRLLQHAHCPFVSPGDERSVCKLDGFLVHCLKLGPHVERDNWGELTGSLCLWGQMARGNQDNEGEACVTLVVTRVLAKGTEDKFRDWSDRVDRSAANAHGHRGCVRIEQTGGLFHTLQRFVSANTLAAWQHSNEFAKLMHEGDQFSTPRVQEVPGPQAAVRLPSDGDGPKWKLFLMSWIGVLPLVLLFNGAVQLLPQQPPWHLRALLQSCFLVALMTWLVRPMVSRRLKPWAMRDGDGDARVTCND